MDELIDYFKDLYHLDRHVTLPQGVVDRLNALDRVQRGELKSRLFTEAKRLGLGGDGLQAIRWIEWMFTLIERHSFRLHDVLFSPGQDIPENLAFYISHATRSLDLCVYTISDDTLSNCLMAVRERGVKVRIISDGNKMRDAGSKVKELARLGFDVKIDQSRWHMHNKFGVIDGRIAFTGSYNWTYTAKAHNQENLVVTTNFTIVHKFMSEFEKLWEEMYWLRPPSRGKGRRHTVTLDAGQGQPVGGAPQTGREGGEGREKGRDASRGKGRDVNSGKGRGANRGKDRGKNGGRGRDRGKGGRQGFDMGRQPVDEVDENDVPSRRRTLP